MKKDKTILIKLNLGDTYTERTITDGFVKEAKNSDLVDEYVQSWRTNHSCCTENHWVYGNILGSYNTIIAIKFSYGFEDVMLTTSTKWSRTTSSLQNSVERLTPIQVIKVPQELLNRIYLLTYEGTLYRKIENWLTDIDKYIEEHEITGGILDLEKVNFKFIKEFDEYIS